MGIPLGCSDLRRRIYNSAFSCFKVLGLMSDAMFIELRDSLRPYEISSQDLTCTQPVAALE